MAFSGFDLIGFDFWGFSALDFAAACLTCLEAGAALDARTGLFATILVVPRLLTCQVLVNILETQEYRSLRMLSTRATLAWHIRSALVCKWGRSHLF